MKAKEYQEKKWEYMRENRLPGKWKTTHGKCQNGLQNQPTVPWYLIFNL